MIGFRVSSAMKCLACIAFCAILSGAITEAAAQRKPTTGDNGASRHRSGGGGGGNVGGLILQFAPAIIKGLNNRSYDDDAREDQQPVRKKRRIRDNDDGGRKTRRPSRPRIIIRAIPPLPVIPPDRGQPPPSVGSGPPPTPLQRAIATAERPRFKDAEVVVLVRDAEPDSIATGLAQNFNLVLQETLSLALLEAARIYRFSIPGNRPVETVVTAMANAPGVGFAVPNSYYWLQGGARSSTLNLQYALPKMRVPDAQAMASGLGMSVAVIDSAVDVNHPSLKAANVTVIDALKRGVEGPDMHGTAIAGIIAARGDVSGIAPGAKIVAVRAFAPEKLGAPPVTTATTLARSVDEAFAQGARIFNMSFAGEREPLLIEVIDAAYKRGSVFIAAAGNEGPDAPPAYPAAYEKVIAITATDEADKLYGRANRGGYVLAAAPGVDILAPVTGQGFDYLSGTSFAAAHVSGIIALMMERNPKLTAEGVSEVLVNAAHDLGPVGQDKDFGAGLTDAYQALLLADGKQEISEKK
jgi:subtilisin family serine protease